MEAVVGKPKLLILFTAACIFITFFHLGGLFIAVFLGFCFLPLIYTELNEHNITAKSFMDTTKHHVDFLLLVLIFAFFLIGTWIENR